MMTGVKYDQDKPRYDLVPFGALDEVASVLGYGANKYSDDNWNKLDNLEKRYIAAALRHISKDRQGEEIDPESGYSHLAHAVTSLMFILQNRINTGGNYK